VEKILPGEVIIATNLAGRGTDIQTDEIEMSGGLHVILTFMPSNQRVEDQAFGRTARQEKRGTGLIILNAHSLVGYTTTHTNTITKKATKEERDEMEFTQLMKFKENELSLIHVKDELFATFCPFLNVEIGLPIRREHSSYDRQVINWATQEVLPSVYESNVLAAVEEQWAGFLSNLDNGTIKCEDAENQYEAFIEQLRGDFRQNKVIKNPFYYICIANDILVNEWAITPSKVAQWAITSSLKVAQ